MIAAGIEGRSLAIERGNDEVEAGKSVRTSVKIADRRLIGLGKFMLGIAGFTATAVAVTALTGVAGFLPGLIAGATFGYLGAHGLLELVTGKKHFGLEPLE